jgi:putative ABC transport system ATP-binding protein
MPQGLSLPCEWVKEMVNLPFKLRVNKGNTFSEETLMKYFDTLGLERGLLEKRLHEISGGQRQRILLAITAMQEKSLVIIDEPTSALDRISTQKAIQFVRQLGEAGRTVVAVSHDIDFMKGCNKVVEMGG